MFLIDVNQVDRALSMVVCPDQVLGANQIARALSRVACPDQILLTDQIDQKEQCIKERTPRIFFGAVELACCFLVLRYLCSGKALPERNVTCE